MSTATPVLERWSARLLRPFARVEAGEALTALALTMTVFLLLTAYYFLKVAREPLILLHGGAEVKSYAAAGQSLLLLVVVRAYSELARRVGRMKLVATVYLFIAGNLVLLAALARADVGPLGVVFYLWVGVFNVTAIAQFWSFANDIYTAEQGKRLFAILGIGSSVGAVVGAKLAKQLAELGPAGLMIAAALILVICVAIFAIVDRRERASAELAAAGKPASTPPQQAISGKGAFELLAREPYLIAIAALIFLLNCVNSNGEYILDRTLLATVSGSGTDGVAAEVFVARFKAEYFQWVNLLGVLLQLFVVSRVLRFAGVRASLYVMPIVSFASYGVMLFSPLLPLIRIGKVLENSLDYSLQNTARQALFLVTTRAEKYVGKQFIDTFVVRLGDVCSAGLVWLFGRLELPVQAFCALNLGLIAVWLVVVVLIGREHRRRAEVEGVAAEAAQ